MSLWWSSQWCATSASCWLFQSLFCGIHWEDNPQIFELFPSVHQVQSDPKEYSWDVRTLEEYYWYYWGMGLGNMGNLTSWKIPSHPKPSQAIPSHPIGPSSGFIFSLLFGLLCACVAFVVQAARSDPVRFAFYPGRGVRSRQMRSQRELRILEEFDQTGFLILRLHGVLFFGNTSLGKHWVKHWCFFPGLTSWSP